MKGLIPNPSLWPAYDARNLDPTIVGAPDTWGNPWVSPTDDIAVGETATGFSFVAYSYDPSPKYYYEFVAS